MIDSVEAYVVTDYVDEYALNRATLLNAGFDFFIVIFEVSVFVCYLIWVPSCVNHSSYKCLLVPMILL